MTAVERKIPVIELAFIKDQREKVGSIGPHQIGPVVFPETRRQVLQKERQAKKKEDETKWRTKSEKRTTEEEEMTLLEVEQRECKEYEDIMEESVKDYYSDEDKNYSPAESEATADSVKTRKRARYNTKDINNIALASLRHHTGLRETVEIATAAWIDAGLVTQFLYDSTSLLS